MPNLKPIRRSQLISPFGVGAIVAFPGDESLMTAGLDEWPHATQPCPPDWKIREERLEQRLSVSHFRLPPDYREPGHGIEHPNQYIPFVRFPQWHYCPLRGVMERVPLFSTPRRCPCRSDLDCHSRPLRRRPWLIPSRFIAVCVRGHVEDFPFLEWLHGSDGCDAATQQLRLLPGRSSATLAGVKVECTCGKKKSMGGTFNFSASKGGVLHKIGYDCSGTTPWLGKSGQRGQCGEYLRVVQRGASNVYFPLTTSSIHLPRGSTNAASIAAKYLDDAMTWLYLSSDRGKGERISLSRCEEVVRSRDIRDMTAAELRKAAQAKLDGDPPQSDSRVPSEEAFRRQEYETLRTGTPDTSEDLLVEVFPSARYGLELRDALKGVGLVRRLRETRAFIGFSRLLPAEDPTDPRILPISLRRLGWLPAIVVHGEGIFFEFDSTRLADWSGRRSIGLRIEALNRRYNERRQARGLAQRKVTAKYVLLHTFAHVLITQLSLDCGYGAASLRERLYCELDDNNAPMQGVLIYTASGDSEGTLGGLVRQGHPGRLTGIFRRAIRRSQWCSSDPVCIGSAGQGSDNANLAACHNCTLLPETSCETGNRLLDRALIVGTAKERGIGFFTKDRSEA